MSTSLGTYRCFHPQSGNVLVGEVTERNADGDVRLIPEGLLEEVVLRHDVWLMTPVAKGSGMPGEQRD